MLQYFMARLVGVDNDDIRGRHEYCRRRQVDVLTECDRQCKPCKVAKVGGENMAIIPLNLCTNMDTSTVCLTIPSQCNA